MSVSAYRYQAARDRNTDLRERIRALAQSHRHYGAGMIYLKLRQQGLCVNHKGVIRRKACRYDVDVDVARKPLRVSVNIDSEGQIPLCIERS